MDFFGISGRILIAPVTVDIVLKAVFTFGVFIVLRKFIAKTIIKFLKNIAVKNNAKGIAHVLDSIEAPLKTFFLLSGIYFALIILPLNVQLSVLLLKLFRCAVIITVARCLLELEDTYMMLQEKLSFSKDKNKLKTLGPVFAKIIKILILLIAAAAIAKEFDYHLNSLLAGLGIGGIAVAMAAQDALKNFFGGFVIITDHPFNSGDIVKVGNNEGIVEDIGLRSTKIRTFEKELITVPNSKFSDGPVINYSRRGLRRVRFHLGATYSTSAEKLRTTIKKIIKMLDEHEVIDSESILVKFDGFGGSSLDILVMYFVKSPDYQQYMNIKEEVNFNIMKIFEEEEVEFAFPSMSLYFENELRNKQDE